MRFPVYLLVTTTLLALDVLALPGPAPQVEATSTTSTTSSLPNTITATNDLTSVTPTPISTFTTATVSTTSGTSCVPSPPWAALKPRTTGPPIRALDGWAAGTFLQKDSGSSAAKLGPASSRGWFVTASSIRLIYTCPSLLYLNILEASTSYKPLAFEETGVTFSWTFSTTDGTIGTASGANSFVACSAGDLYLQTGTDLPQGNCTTTRLTLFPET